MNKLLSLGGGEGRLLKRWIKRKGHLLRKTGLCLALAFALIVAEGMLVADAEALTFNDTANGLWNVGTTWDQTVCASSCAEGTDYPGSGDDAIINSNTVTLADNNGDVNNITIASGGTLDAASYTITVSGNWDSSGGTFTFGTSKVVMTGTSKTIDTVASTHFAHYRFYSLTISSGATITANTSFNVKGGAGGVFTISGTLTVASGVQVSTYNSASQSVVINSGAEIAGAGTFNIYDFGGGYLMDNSGTISVNTFKYTMGWADDGLVTATTYGGNLIITEWVYDWNDVAVITRVSGDTTSSLVVNGTLTILPVATGTKLFTVDNSTNNIDVIAQAFVLGDSSDNARYAKLVCGSASYDINGNVTIYDGSAKNELDAGSSSWAVSGNWTNNDVFTAGTSRIDFDGSSDQSITSGGDPFYNLDISNTSNTVTLADAADIATNGRLTIDSSATLALDGQNLVLNTVLNFVNDGTLQLDGDESTVTLTNDTDTGTVEYIGDGDSTSDTDTIKQLGGTYFNLTINDPNGTPANREIFQLGSGLGVVGDLTVTSGTLDYNSQTLTLSGTSKNFTINTDGIVTGSGGTTNITGTITYTDDSTSGTQNIGALTVD